MSFTIFLGFTRKRVFIQPAPTNNIQLLDVVEKNIVICQWRVDQLFPDAEGRGK
jgi:hypothetical protein